MCVRVCMCVFIHFNGCPRTSSCSMACSVVTGLRSPKQGALQWPLQAPLLVPSNFIRGAMDWEMGLQWQAWAWVLRHSGEMLEWGNKGGNGCLTWHFSSECWSLNSAGVKKVNRKGGSVQGICSWFWSVPFSCSPKGRWHILYWVFWAGYYCCQVQW